METFATEFDQTLVRINDGRQQRAQTAHGEVRRVLEGASNLQEWGINTILIGSYARLTSIHPGKDVDVFCKFTELDTGARPQSVYDELAGVLRAAFGARAKPQNRSIKIEFDFQAERDLFHVDCVPAVQMSPRWAIPNGDRNTWDGHDSWTETDPEELTERTIVRNQQPVLGGRGMYLPLVRLVKQVRSHHLADAKPGSLYFELLTYWAFENGLTSTGSFAECLSEVLLYIARRLDFMERDPLYDPVLQRPYQPVPEREELRTAFVKFKELSAKTQSALESELCPAAALWRYILGRNPRGWCFTIPDGCDEEGKTIAPIVAVRSRGSREATSFGDDYDGRPILP